MFIRFSVAERDEDSLEERGILQALYELEEQGDLAPHELEWFRAVVKWMGQNLAVPDRLARSRRPNAKNRAICWLKCTSQEHVARIREAVEFLKYKGISVRQYLTDRPGYIVYEDDHQIAAIPFESETF